MDTSLALRSGSLFDCLLLDFFHVFAAADKSATTDLGHHYFIAADIAPVLLTDHFNAHVRNLLLFLLDRKVIPVLYITTLSSILASEKRYLEESRLAKSPPERTESISSTFSWGE